MINQPQKDNKDIYIKRLIYRSWHRGCKETDGALGHYAKTHLAQLSDAEISLFEQLLEEDDWDIWNWLTGKTKPKRQFTDLIETIKATTPTQS